MAMRLTALLPLLCSGSGEPWEWAGVFNFDSAGHHTWSASRGASGAYANTVMKMAVKKLTAPTKAALDGAHSAVEGMWDTNVKNIVQGGEMEAEDAFYNVNMDSKTWVTNFELHVDSPGAYGFFANPAPADYEKEFHYLRTEAGVNIEPVVEDKDGGHGHHGSHGAAGAVDSHAVEALCPKEMHWEWAGIFELAAGYHTWSAERAASGSYADATMKIIFLKVADHNEGTIEAAQKRAMTMWDGSATTVESGNTIELDTMYSLKFDTHSWGSFFYLNVPAASAGDVVIYGQHLPTEFENKFHYLKNAASTNIEPAAQKTCAGTPAAAPTSTGNKHLLADVIFASLITCLPTLIGAIFLYAKIEQVKAMLERTAPIVNSFASGTIFAAALFLLLPEALHLAGAGHMEEVVGTWTWGTSVLVGWFTCFLTVHGGNLALAGYSAAGGSTDKGAEGGAEGELSFREKFAICAPVLLGDFFHNFSDGLVIGVAFRVCGTGFGWELTGVTVAHELPQELADSVILISDGKLPWYKATFFNFLCSLSTVVGAMITYNVSVGQNEEGYILAYGGGTYLFIALTEMAEHILKAQKPNVVAMQVLAFAVGTILMGLVLLGHEHCSAPAPAPVPGQAPAPPSGGHHH